MGIYGLTFISILYPIYRKISSGTPNTFILFFIPKFIVYPLFIFLANNNVLSTISFTYVQFLICTPVPQITKGFCLIKVLAIIVITGRFSKSLLPDTEKKWSATLLGS